MSEAKKLDQADEVLELTISYEERGKEKGRELGIKEGKELERKGIALSMLKKGYEIEDIHELTQLPVKQIQELKEDLSNGRSN